MSWLSSFLHPEKGYQEAQNQLKNYFNEAQSQLQPYNNAGLEQYGNLKEMIDSFMNPGKLQDQWIKDYTESESTKNAENMASEHGLNAASSMGLLGSNTALNALQKGTTGIGLDARQKYLDDMMQKYMAGANLASSIFGTGSNTANNMANNTMNMGNNMAQIKFGETNSPGSSFGNLLGLGGSIAGSALGGPIGGALAKRWNLSGGA